MKSVKLIRMTEETEAALNCEYNEFDWGAIACTFILSDDFIRKHHRKLNWNDISRLQDLSEELILEFDQWVFWDIIAEHQSLSESFLFQILSTTSYLDREWHSILRHYNLSKDLITLACKTEKADVIRSLVYLQMIPQDVMVDVVIPCMRKLRCGWSVLCGKQMLSLDIISNNFEYIDFKALNRNDLLEDDVKEVVRAELILRGSKI